jgi:hypothetical protein
MLETLISSKTRVKLLIRFFLNPDSRGYLRVLASEFGESTNGIRVELNRLEAAGLLRSNIGGNKKYFEANVSHPLFNDIRNIILKHIGFDKIIDKIVNNLGELRKVYITGSFAKGLDSNVIDLIFVGDDINKEYLVSLVEKTEKLIHRKIRYLVILEDEVKTFVEEKDKENILVLWEKR